MRALWQGRIFPSGTVFRMTLFGRKPGEGMYTAVHPLVMMKRMWLLLLIARRSPKRVPRKGKSRRVKARRT